MAVAFDACVESHTGTTGSTSEASFSWTHTPTGVPKGILVMATVGPGSSNDLVSGITYGGVAMTQIGNAVDSVGEPGRTYLYFLGSGIPTGNQVVTVSRTNNAATIWAASASVTADSSTTSTGTVLTQTGDVALGTLSPADDEKSGTPALRFSAAHYGGNAVPTAAAGSTVIAEIDLGTVTKSMVRENTAGNGARAVGWNDIADDTAVCAVAIQEVRIPALTMRQRN